MSSFKKKDNKDINLNRIKNTIDDILKEPIIEPIFLIQQFFISNNNGRQKEINYCLQQNVNNKFFDKIILVNERIYTKEELGIDNIDNIIQINIRRRLMFSDVFMAVKKMNLKGYIVFSNSDIIFTPSIKNVYFSTMSQRPVVQCLSKYNIDDINKNKINPIVNNKNISQDTWILHSNFIPKDKFINKFSFNFGTWACDNHILYLFKYLNYLPKNEFRRYITYHYHTSEHRTYDKKNIHDNKVCYFI